MDTVTYKTDKEIVSEWLAEKTIKNPMGRELVDDLFGDFRDWHMMKSKAVFSRLRMVKAMKSLGYRMIRTTGCRRWFLGLEIQAGWTGSNPSRQ
jgi:hypothetical protein